MSGGEDRGAFRTWYLSLNPGPVLCFTVPGALAGGGLLHIATLVPNTLIGLVGVLIATACAWIATDYTSVRWRSPDRASWRRFVVACGGFGTALVVAAAVAAERQIAVPFFGFLGLVALTIGVSPLVAEVRDDADNREHLWMLAGMAASGVAAVVVASPVPGVVRLVAIAVGLAGLGFYTGGLSVWLQEGVPHRHPILEVFPGPARARALFAAVVGVVVVVVGVVVDQRVIGVIGAWLVVLAMISLSVHPQRYGFGEPMQRALLGFGALAVIAGGSQLLVGETIGRSAWFVAFLTASIALVGAWIVWRGATLFLGVLLGFVFVWGMFSNTVDDTFDVSGSELDPSERESAGVVALGDSFISGEGARRFYNGTDQKGDQRNECRRAPTAYAALIAPGVEPNQDETVASVEVVDQLTEPGLDFHACSGAKLSQVLDTTPDDRSEDANRTVSCETRDDVALGQYPCGPDGVYGAGLQLDELAADVSSTQLVLVSIGGNDVRFGDIVAGCLLPGSCVERREVWLDNVEALGPELTRGYELIRERFATDSDAVVVVMPYPLVVTERTCARSPLDESEHAFIYEFTTVLNQQLATSARQAGVYFFDDGAFAFEGHRVCEPGTPAINVIGLQPTSGPLIDRMNPGSWTHNSMHPNSFGHRLTAGALATWLNDHDVVGSANPEPDASATTELLGVRTARSFALSPSTRTGLQEASTAECDIANVRGFPTRMNVFDEDGGDASRPFPVPIAGADPSAVVCATDGVGAWVALDPGNSDDDMGSPDGTPTATVRDGRIFIAGGRPGDSCTTADPGGDVCDFQWVMFQTASAGEAAAGWELRAVRYCSTDPNCREDFSDWSADKIRRAAREVLPPVVLIFLGGWLAALGWSVLERKPWPGWLKRRLDGARLPWSVMDS